MGDKAKIYEIFKEIIKENESDDTFRGPYKLPKQWNEVKKYLGLNPFWVKENAQKYPKIINFSKCLYKIILDETGIVYGDIEEYAKAIYEILGMINNKRCCVLVDAIVIGFCEKTEIFKDFMEYIIENKNISLYIPKRDNKDITYLYKEKEDIIARLNRDEWVRLNKNCDIYLVNNKNLVGNKIPNDILKLPYTKASTLIYNFQNKFYMKQLNKYRKNINDQETDELSYQEMIEDPNSGITEDSINRDLEQSYEEFYNSAPKELK